MSEPMIKLLADLQLADPDPSRGERTRMRCRARLASRRRVTTSSAPSGHGRNVVFWQPLIAVLSVAYFAAAVVQALRAYGSP